MMRDNGWSRDQSRAIAIGKPVQYQALSDTEFRALANSLGWADDFVSMMLGFYDTHIRSGRLWFAKASVEQQLTDRAQAPTEWNDCSVCGTQLVSKGFAKRQMFTLIGEVEWKRRLGRCPRRCPGSHQVPFDAVLNIDAHQQTSTDIRRLGCLLAVFLPFDLAASILQQLSGISVSEDTIWNWVQIIGQQAKQQLEAQLQAFSSGEPVQSEALDSTLNTMPLVIAADGVTVPFWAQPKTSKGAVVWICEAADSRIASLEPLSFDR